MLKGQQPEPSHVVDLLYNAAMEPRLWPAALDRMGDALGGAALIAGHFQRGELGFRAVNRFDPESADLLFTRYARPETNPFVGGVPRLPLLVPIQRQALVEERDYRKSELFNEVFRPQRLVHAAASCLAREGEHLITCGVLRRAGAQFDANDISLLAMLLPHLRRAVELTIRLSNADLAHRRAAAFADAHPDGLIIVDERCRVLFNNSAAESILARGDGLCRRGGFLGIPDQAHGHRLARLVQDAALFRNQRGGSIRIDCANAARTLAVKVTPLPDDLRETVNRGVAAALVSIVDLAAVPPLQEQHLAHLFGLSRAEVALTQALFEGKRLEDIASERAVRMSTIRSQIRSILAKTGTQRQSELIRLLGRITGSR